MKKTRKFWRAAMLLLMMMLTATTAWAELTVKPTIGGTVTVSGTEVTATPNDGYYVNRVFWYETDPDGGEVGSSVELDSDGMGHYLAPLADGFIVVRFHKYSDYNGVRVTFNMKNHGADIPAQDLHLGETVTQPDDPTAKDYVFLGWYTNSSCTKPYDFDTVLDNTLKYDTYNDHYTLTLYAKWQVGGGTCGKTTTWAMTKSTGSSDYDVLTISGTGAMKDYGNKNNRAPWYQDYRSTIKTVVIDEGVTKIGSSAFNDCGALTSVTIPASVTSIGECAFDKCGALTSVTIPANVTSIGKKAFYDCGALTSVTIPASVTSIGDDAFMYCTSLRSVTVYASAVPTLGGSCVFDNNADGRKIYVFSDLESDYESAENWDRYEIDIEPITLGVNDAGGTLGSWTTYYNGLADVRVSEGTTIYKAALSGDKKSVMLTQVSGNIVKRGEAVLLKSTTDIKLSSAANSGTGDYTDNALRGVDYATATSTLGEGTFYVLGKEGDHFGFHKFTDATMPAQKAYLLLSGDTPSSLNITLDNSGTTQLVCRWTPQDGGTVTVDNGTQVTATPANGYYVNSVIWYETDPDLGGEVGSFVELNDNGMGYYEAPQPYGYVVVTFGICSNNVRVRFNMNGHGAAIDDQDLTLGQTVERPTPDPTEEDYVFLGWFEDSNCTKPYNFNTVLDNTLAYDTRNNRYKLTLYAGWVVVSGSCGKIGTEVTWAVTKSAGSDNYDVLTISGTGAMTDYQSKKAPWYNFRNLIKTIVIDEGVTAISQFAFEDFFNVSSDITIPASVTSIGNQAFAGVSRNTTAGIHITAAEGSALVTIGQNVFNGVNASIDLSPCTSLTAISNVYVFDLVTKDVTLPSSVTSICQWAFSKFDTYAFRGDHAYVVVPDGKALSVTIDGVTEPVVIEPTDGKADILGCLYADPAARHESRALTLALVADQTTPTGIDSIRTTDSDGTERWYTLDGRRLPQKPTLRGIYINNGKKVAIK